MSIIKSKHIFLICIFNIFIILTHCQLQEPKKVHGINFLENREKVLIVNKTNKNDVVTLIGKPHLTSITYPNKWIYFQRTMTKGKLHKLGQNVLKENNVLELNFDKYGVLKDKKLYKKEIQIVTASDNIFFESLCQLIRNLKKYEEDIQIIIYDIGLEREQKSKLLSEFKDIKYKEFNFSNYPVFIGKRDEYKKLGHYAWKSIIIHKELTESKNQILWFDTGNLITKKLTLLRIVLTAYGIFSPISNGTIKEWTHIETLKYLQVSKRIQNKRNLTGGIIGFDWSSHYARKIAEDWKKYSTKKECIAPPGSDRGNHRQDQSIFSILKYKEKHNIV